MPWYRTGTVAITAGQTTVTGTGTNFSANARVGDAFQGPDGRWYEVTNIASSTVLSILPAYQGATVAAGAYGLAPMQGYVKESADRLRQLIDQFGAIIAGLGTASTANVTTSSTDKAAGRLLKNGDYGLTVTSIPLGGGTDANTITDPGNYALAAGGVNLPATVTAYYLEVQAHGALVIQRLWGMTAGVASKSYTRVLVSGVWSAWSEKLSRTDIVGAVSQSGGVPTGGIIERGSNANGEYVKFADGTMNCTGTVSGSVATSIASGSLYYSAALSWSFPAPFAVAPSVSCSPSGASANLWASEVAGSTTTSACAFYIMNTASQTVSVVRRLIAIGRWF
ncbi:pyocin knob domain-containing protein [Pseudomonas putida]|uniref:pyocin knob domain-containing protein n=1 Tax=Pseudomonas putida TaxID=303 RepID=UPI0018658A77|nr:pyocin knob domain-containing protein [Pseudomonas putida]